MIMPPLMPPKGLILEVPQSRLLWCIQCMGHAVHVDCIILLQCMVLFLCVHAWLGFTCRPGECQAVSTEAEAPEELQTDTPPLLVTPQGGIAAC